MINLTLIKAANDKLRALRRTDKEIPSRNLKM